MYPKWLRLAVIFLLGCCLSWSPLRPAAARFQNNPQQVTLVDVLACLVLFQNPGVPLTAQQIATGVSAILNQNIPASSLNPVPNVQECDFVAGSPTGVDLADVIALLVAFQNPGVILTPAQLAQGINSILNSNFTQADILRVPENPPQGQFTITLEFVDDRLTIEQQQILEAAARRWEQVITGDLGSFTVPQRLPDGFCDSGQGGVPIPSAAFPLPAGRVINDVLIQVRVGLLGSATGTDGPGGTLGIAGPCGYFRPGSRLQPFGFAGFDPADLSNPALLEVAVHEFGHVLGIGTLWTGRSGFPSFPSLIEGAFFIGSQGRAQFQSYGGQGNPRVQQPNPFHWDEDVFGAELMTSTLNSGRTNPLSRVTLGALQDLGYTGLVYTNADPYTLGERLHLPGDINLGEDAIIGPVFIPNP
ncbi:MAG: hypothetical protein Q6K70_07225 [Thermostichales cyanobacterium DRC_bins_46]